MEVFVGMNVQQSKCWNEECDYDQQENIPFATGRRSNTYRFVKYVVELLHGMTLQDVANHQSISRETIKEKHSDCLLQHNSLPSLKGVKNIGIGGNYSCMKGN